MNICAPNSLPGRRRRGVTTFLLVLGLWLVQPASGVAQPAVPDSRTFLPGSWQDNLRFAIDLASRPIYSSASDDWHRIDFIGADLHKVFSGDSGDIGTLTLQGYLTHAPDREVRPGFFDGEWEFVYRIFNFNYVLQPRGRMNVKVGHFEIPFGLEYSINTNGTLRDYTHGPNIGVKADWGVSLNGELPGAEYEVSVTRGSGNSWETDGDPYILAGRIGTLRHRNLVFGASVMSGDVYRPNSGGQTVERHRVGADVQWYIDQYGLFAEAAYGEDDDQQTGLALLELNRRSLDGSWMAYAQWVYRSRDRQGASRQDAGTLHIGAKWDINPRWDVSVQLSHDTDSFEDSMENNRYVAQARYRF
ncbi:MAG: hypothetical protein R3228_19340 [Halioglobus sp.]|nr:hypothetical protein [Halioglobus sp.]